MSAPSRLGACVGITNSRMNAAKRGVAVEVAARVARTLGEPVCLVGADPTDRDVERHLPRLVAEWGEPKRMEITRGPHRLEVANFPEPQVCVVSVSDREGIESVLPTLRARFRFVIIDAPSRAGNGVGIADVLLDWLDALVVATGLTAGDLAETRQYVEHIGALPGAQRVDVRVLAIDGSDASGLAQAQLDSRLAALPMIGHVPRLTAQAANRGRLRGGRLEDPFGPLVRWIVEGPDRVTTPFGIDARHGPDTLAGHVANRLYREGLDP
jgi:hypothetical protein